MGAYDYIDNAVAGLLYGLDNQIEGGGVARQTAGIEFGYPAFGYVGDSKGVYSHLKDVQKLVFDADLITGNLIDLKVNTVSMAQVTYATSHDNTMDLIIAALEAMDGVQAVLDATDANNRTIYILTKGVTCSVTDAAVTGGASQAGITLTANTAQVYLGMVVKTQNAPGLYEQYDAVNVLVDGYVYGQAGTAADSNSPAYVGADGKLANTGEELNATFRQDITAAGLVLVQTKGQKQLGVSALFAQ